MFVYIHPSLLIKQKKNSFTSQSPKQGTPVSLENNHSTNARILGSKTSGKYIGILIMTSVVDLSFSKTYKDRFLNANPGCLTESVTKKRVVKLRSYTKAEMQTVLNAQVQVEASN